MFLFNSVGLAQAENFGFDVALLSASLSLLFDPFSILSAAFWLGPYGACFVLLRIYQTTIRLDLSRSQTWQQQLIFALKLLIESQWKIFCRTFAFGDHFL